MKRYLKPFGDCHKGAEDTFYYHIIDRATGIEAYVFSEYNSLFTNNEHKIVGKCFYLHLPTEYKPYYGEFKTKRIAGKTFLNLGYKRTIDGYIVNSDASIKKFVSEKNIFPDSSVDNIFLYNYSCFDEDYVAGVSEPRVVLKHLYRTNSAIQKVVAGIIEEFGVCIEDLGITGSLSIGAKDSSDYDIVFYGDIKKLNDIRLGIDSLKTRHGSVVEYGLKWPCRYYDHKSNLICCFFVCTDYNYEIFKTTQIICDNYMFDTVVQNDRHSLLKAPVLDIYDKTASSIVILNSGFKGVFREGDRIRGEGRLIKYINGGKEQYSILCASPFEEICNYAAYFNR